MLVSVTKSTFQQVLTGVRYGHRYKAKPFASFEAVGLFNTTRKFSNQTDQPRMMPFVDYRKLRRRLKLRSRLAGLPMALTGVALSSAVNIHFQPQMLEFQSPDVELAPIL